MGNFIGEYKNAISDEVIDYLMDYFMKNKEWHVHGEVGTGQIDKTVKDSHDLNLLDDGEYDPYLVEEIFPLLGNQLDSAILKYSKEYQASQIMVDAIKGSDNDILNGVYKYGQWWPYSILMKRYLKGQGGYHSFHEDNGTQHPHTYRSHVVMFYLNDVLEGGETEFHNQQLKVKPEKGKVVIFPAYWTHLHKGHIPISGDKYICNFWILKGNGGETPTIGNKWLSIMGKDGVDLDTKK